MKNLALGASLLLFLSGCSSPTSLSETEKTELRDQLKRQAKGVKKSVGTLGNAQIKGGQIEIADAKGRPLWRVEAREMKTQGQTENGVPQSATLTDAGATLFREGKPESRFRAQTIQLFNSKAGVRLNMTGQVVASSQGLSGAPIEVRAPRADVDVAKRTLAASGGVVAKRGDTTLQTPALTGQSSLQTLRCNDATLSSPGAKVKAASVQLNWKSDRLQAGNIVATQSGTTLRGQRLDADTRVSRGVLTGKISASAQSGTASGERLEFNWKRDRLFVPEALFQKDGATIRVSSLATDTKLRVTSAGGVRASQNGATLTAKSARGLDNLSQLSGSGITIRRGDLLVEAGAATTRDWSKESGEIRASGGVFARTSSGSINAQSATWSGGAQTGRVVASGNVVVRGAQGTLRGERAQSDARFQNAGMSGNVSGELSDGTRLRAKQLQKRDLSYVATGGASATLPDGTLVSASRVEGNARSALATGGASATLPDGTQLRAGRVEKRGQSVVATGAARATLPPRKGFGRVEISAARVEGTLSQSRVVASGGVVLRTATGATVRAPRAIYSRATGKITATGGVSLSDPARGLSQTGTSLVADLGMKQVEIANVRGQGKAGSLNMKGLF